MQRAPFLIPLSILIAGLIHSASAYAFTARCSSEFTHPKLGNLFREEQREHDTPGRGVVLLNISRTTCVTENDLRINLDELLIGPELYGSSYEFANFRFHCPWISEKRLAKVLDRRGAFSVSGLQAAIGLAVGIQAGIAINHRGAVCFLTDPNGLAIGAGATLYHARFSREGTRSMFMTKESKAPAEEPLQTP